MPTDWNAMTTQTQPAIPINTIRITDKAATKVKEFARSKAMPRFGLKVSVKGGGCSGLTYVLDIVDGPDEADKVIEDQGVELYVPKKAFVYLAGMLLDFSDGLNGKGFTFSNPNAKKTCGCGTSFSV